MTANYPESGSGAYAGDAGTVGEPTTTFESGGQSGDQSGAGAAKEQVKDQAKQTAGTAKDETRHVAGVAQGEAQKVAGVAQDEAQRVASEAKSQVSHLVNQATSQVEEQSRTQLGRLAQTLRSFGEDLASMASSSTGPASGLAHEAADRVQGLASALENREPRDLLEDARSFARRRPGAFLGSALAAGVVAGRLTRGAKAAQSGNGSSGSAYDSPRGYARTADVTSPGQPLSTGYAAGSSGPISDPSTQGYGTATGDPLAGTGRPATDPVYPGGSGLRGDLS